VSVTTGLTETRRVALFNPDGAKHFFFLFDTIQNEIVNYCLSPFASHFSFSNTILREIWSAFSKEENCVTA
jgi:hypothetical protein